MGLLHDQMAVDSETFTDTDAFGESVLYSPRNGTAVTIYAVVERDSRRLESMLGEAMIGAVEVWIRNDSLKGRASIDTGGDRVTLADRMNGTARSMKVAQIIDQDDGMWHLALK